MPKTFSDTDLKGSGLAFLAIDTSFTPTQQVFDIETAAVFQRKHAFRRGQRAPTNIQVVLIETNNDFGKKVRQAI